MINKQIKTQEPELPYSIPVRLTSGKHVVIATLLIVILFSSCLLAYPIYSILDVALHKNQFDRAKFNQTIWEADKNSTLGANRRAGMAEDILKKRLKPGMTLNETKAMLGEVEYTDARAEVQIPNSEKYSHAGYYLGAEIGGEYRNFKNVDRAWLDLKFDKSGNYVSGGIYLPR